MRKLSTWEAKGFHASAEPGVGDGAQYCEAVRHATSAALDELEPLLERLRALPGLVERKRGVFYLRSRAFLHFHEDPSGLHADVRLDENFQRFRVHTPPERAVLFDRIRTSEALVT